MTENSFVAEVTFNKYFWFLLKFGPTIFMYYGKTFRRQVSVASN